MFTHQVVIKSSGINTQNYEIYFSGSQILQRTTSVQGTH